jgi:hypothetical protein
MALDDAALSLQNSVYDEDIAREDDIIQMCKDQRKSRSVVIVDATCLPVVLSNIVDDYAKGMSEEAVEAVIVEVEIIKKCYSMII